MTVDWSVLIAFLLAEFVLGFTAGYAIRSYRALRSQPSVRYPSLPPTILMPPGSSPRSASIPLVPDAVSDPAMTHIDEIISDLKTAR